MAKTFLTPIDMSKNELQNFALQNLATAPSTPSIGQTYLDTGSTNQPTYWNGSAWVQFAIRGTNAYTGKQTLAAASASVSGSLNIPTGSGNTPISGDLYNVAGALTFYNGAAKTLAYTDSAITSTTYIGTTPVALNRVSAAIALTGITSIDGSAASATTAGKATNLVGGNTTTLLGALPYQSNTDTTTLLAPNVVATQKFLGMTGTGTNGAPPLWAALANGDIPTALTGKTYNGLTVSTSTGTLTIATAKTFTANNTLALSGTDGATLNIGAGGTLGSAAYTAASAYATLANSLDQFATPTADLAIGGFKLTGVATPVAGTDAANKQYVDDTVAGLSWKNECRVATTLAGTLATSFANGQSVDGQVLATNDRILIKDQTAQAENGIYVVQAAGAPVRATDADTDAEVKGAAVFIWQGTSNGGTRWINNATGAITLGTTALVFVAFGGGQTYTGSNGILLSASNFTVQPDTGGQSGLSVSATGVKIDPTVALGAANTYVTRRIGFPVGDGAATSYVLTHNLGTRDVVVSVYRATTPWDEVGCDIQKTSDTTVTLVFAIAPTAAQFQAVVQG